MPPPPIDVAQENLESRLKKSTADLLELERVLTSCGVDPRVLRDFRDAVDYVRKSAWAVQEWQEREARNRDTSTVLPLLMFERIRRATDLCKLITIELDDYASEQVPELLEAMDASRWRLSAG